MNNGKEMTYEEVVDLLNENEQLKKELYACKDARKAYKQDGKACVSYCDEYKDEINILKDNIEGLKEENKQLKKDYQQLHQIESKLRVNIKELKQKLCQIDKLIDDLGHEEMKRQYTNIVD